MSNIHTYVYSVGEENRAIVEPEIQGSKILEQGLEHLMQEACFLSAQPTRETYIYLLVRCHACICLGRFNDLLDQDIDKNGKRETNQKHHFES